jgi:hypothetical protein
MALILQIPPSTSIRLSQEKISSGAHSMDEDRLDSPSVIVRGMMTLSTLVAQALLIKSAFREFSLLPLASSMRVISQ